MLEVAAFLVALAESKVDSRLEELAATLMLVATELSEVVVPWEGQVAENCRTWCTSCQTFDLQSPECSCLQSPRQLHSW